MKSFLILLISLIPVLSIGQSKDSLLKEIQHFQADQNEHYFDKETSPLKKKERRKFKGHDFFPVDLSFRVTAKFEVIMSPDTIVMPTSAGTEKMFAKHAKLTFEINGESCILYAYQNLKVIKMEGYENSLFVPFRDETTALETYGGGRYLDLEIPEGDELILNFNLAYNPYCAYTTGWFCPIPPDDNTLKVAVKAGLMKPEEH
ncbi:MAG: hypothetical protein ACI857_000161 [Arenicella sp.]|jgi:uncharacterized protein (DUF1684 family)